ncbi:MAG: hypothetical protein ACOYXB_13475 [Bacteroidota bacterium]
MNFLLHFIFVAAFMLVYIVGIIILKPFRIHKKRPVSTVSLKLSYLFYLACFMVLAYLVLFASPTSDPSEEVTEEKVLNVFTLFSVSAFFLPNLGIMIRRAIKDWRISYNYIFTVLNLGFAGGLLYYLFHISWEFR